MTTDEFYRLKGGPADGRVILIATRYLRVPYLTMESGLQEWIYDTEDADDAELVTVDELVSR